MDLLSSSITPVTRKWHARPNESALIVFFNQIHRTCIAALNLPTALPLISKVLLVRSGLIPVGTLKLSRVRWKDWIFTLTRHKGSLPSPFLASICLGPTQCSSRFSSWSNEHQTLQRVEREVSRGGLYTWAGWMLQLTVLYELFLSLISPSY